MDPDAPEALEGTIARYNDAWNAHDLDAIMAMHAPDMVFENHTAGERAEGEAVREHIGKIFAAWPDLEFATRRLYVREDLVVQEWTARHPRNRAAPRRARRAAERAQGRVGRDGRDPLRGRSHQAQGCVLRLGRDPPPGGAALTPANPSTLAGFEPRRMYRRA